MIKSTSALFRFIKWSFLFGWMIKTQHKNQFILKQMKWKKLKKWKTVSVSLHWISFRLRRMVIHNMCSFPQHFVRRARVCESVETQTIHVIQFNNGEKVRKHFNSFICLFGAARQVKLLNTKRNSAFGIKLIDFEMLSIIQMMNEAKYHAGKSKYRGWNACLHFFL